jgi:predicted lipid-binding transport protein (Tim44 family)
MFSWRTALLILPDGRIAFLENDLFLAIIAPPAWWSPRPAKPYRNQSFTEGQATSGVKTYENGFQAHEGTLQPRTVGRPPTKRNLPRQRPDGKPEVLADKPVTKPPPHLLPPFGPV